VAPVRHSPREHGHEGPPARVVAGGARSRYAHGMRVNININGRRVQTAPSAGRADNTGFGPWTTVASSNVLQVRYRASDSTMDVQFRNGSTYRYEVVPEHIHTQLLTSVSPGRYMHRHVRHRYKYTRLA